MSYNFILKKFLEKVLQNGRSWVLTGCIECKEDSLSGTSEVLSLLANQLRHCSPSRIPRWPVLPCCVSGFTWFATTQPCVVTSRVRSRPPPPCCTTQRWAHLKPPDWEWCGWISTRLVGACGCCCCTRILRDSWGEEEQKWCIWDRYLLDIVQSEKKSWVQQT